MSYFKIGGKEWDVLVVEASESFEILYSSNTGRTIARGAPMTLDPLGTFFGHKVTVARKRGREKQFDDLLDFVSIPRYSGIDVELVHNQKTIKYKAYISKGERNLKRIDVVDKKVYWDTLTLNIVPIEAQVLPV